MFRALRLAAITEIIIFILAKLSLLEWNKVFHEKDPHSPVLNWRKRGHWTSDSLNDYFDVFYSLEEIHDSVLLLTLTIFSILYLINYKKIK